MRNYFTGVINEKQYMMGVNVLNDDYVEIAFADGSHRLFSWNEETREKILQQQKKIQRKVLSKYAYRKYWYCLVKNFLENTSGCLNLGEEKIEDLNNKIEEINKLKLWKKKASAIVTPYIHNHSLEELKNKLDNIEEKIIEELKRDLQYYSEIPTFTLDCLSLEELKNLLHLVKTEQRIEQNLGKNDKNLTLQEVVKNKNNQLNQLNNDYIMSLKELEEEFQYYSFTQQFADDSIPYPQKVNT